MTAQTTTWIYPAGNSARKSYLTEWACACPAPALHPFTSSVSTHRLECPDCQGHIELDLTLAIDAPNRFGIPPLELRCADPSCRLTTQLWHPLPKGQRIRLACARCRKFGETTAP